MTPRDPAEGSASAKPAPAELDARAPTGERAELTDAEREDARRLRFHRVEKWLERARAVSALKDRDTAFLLYWIAFNAAYAKDGKPRSEAAEFRKYFNTLLRLGGRRAVHDEICVEFDAEIKKVVDNVFLFEPFWEKARNRAEGADAEHDAEWNRDFRAEGEKVRAALEDPAKGDPLTVLVVLFRRLYTLRNQLVHGGATWGGRLNRYSVENGERLLAFTVPIFLRLMRENPDEDWGAPPYWAGLWKGKPDTEVDRGTPQDGGDADPPPPRTPRPRRTPGPAPTPDTPPERNARPLILRLQHLGTAYLSHASAAERLTRVGLPPAELRTDQGRGFQLDSRVLLGNECWLHVVHNWNPEARVCRYLRSVGEGLEHLALEVDDIEAAVERVKRSAPIFEDTIFRAADGFEAFVAPEDAGGFTVELIQPHATSWNWPDPPPRRLSPLLRATHLAEVVAVAPDPAAAAARFEELFGLPSHLPSRPAAPAGGGEPPAVLVPFPNRCALRFEAPADPGATRPGLRALVLETPEPEADRQALAAAGVGTRRTAGGDLAAPAEACGFEVVLRPAPGAASPSQKT